MREKLHYWSAIVILSLLSGLSTICFAQDRVTLRGKIINDSLDDSYLHIVNLTSQHGTITNEEGIFYIPAQEQDTLYISALQFGPQEIIITAEIIEKNNLEIELKTVVNELATVTIKDINLSGRLGDDAGSVAVKPYFDQTNVGFAPTAEERSPEFKALQASKADFGLGTVIDLLSGRRKMLKRNLEISEMSRRVDSARKLLPTTFYVEELEIPENLVNDFSFYIYYGQEKALTIAENENILELINFLKSKAPEYLNIKAKE